MENRKRWRQLTVWLHVLSSAGWMAQAMALCVMLATGLVTDDPAVRAASTSMSLATDGRLLGPMADVSAFTGIMLSAATPWGFFRHWWVLTKFTITIIQLYAGIFLLSPQLQESAVTGPVPLQVAATALMASAIAFQGWLSIAKPWGTVGRRRRRGGGTGPAWVFVAAVLGGLLDLGLAFVLGHPMPLLSIVLVVVVLARRRTWSAPAAGSRAAAGERG
ncbi:hypothetical protein J2S43_001806 [Catenuloplanes nepalensis]|uniref:DUF2269 domain-containing protein n=1 Tax=Catenuloplanes nepalensis TaxID=587533 RepID=A0ABT9MPI4_9ACTN|nr:hypothetical protein [Catenuloplanes nepalensis]MDP9793294.1 hypothetical protein [Catenuloplanes nepalensis]